MALLAFLTVYRFFQPAWDELVTDKHTWMEVVFGTRGEYQMMFGRGPDVVGTLWTFDFATRFISGETSSTVAPVFVPFGLDLGQAQGFGWLDAFISWPLVRALGIPEFYNLHIVLTLLLTQFGLFALFRQIRAPLPVALALPVVFANTPFVFTEIIQGRPTQVYLLFHALHMLFVVRMLAANTKQTRNAIAAGLCLAAACFVYWFSAISVALLTLPVIILAFLCRRPRSTHLLASGLILTAVAGLATIIPTWRLSKAVLAGSSASWISDLQTPGRLLTEIGPVQLWTRVGVYQASSVLDVANEIVDKWGSWPLFGLFAVALGCIPIRWWRLHRKQNPSDQLEIAVIWGVCTLVLFPIVLGAAVSYKGLIFPTAAGLLEQVFPPMARLHFPARTVVGPAMGACVTIALVARIWADSHSKRLTWWIVGMVSIGWALSTPLTKQGTPQVGWTTRYPLQTPHEYLTEQVPGGVIDVPLGTTHMSFVRQIHHRQPILGGPGIHGTSTRPNGHQEYCDNNSMLIALDHAARDQLFFPIRADDVQQLWDDGFRTILLRRKLMGHPSSEVVASLAPWVERVTIPVNKKRVIGMRLLNPSDASENQEGQ